MTLLLSIPLVLFCIEVKPAAHGISEATTAAPLASPSAGVLGGKFNPEKNAAFQIVPAKYSPDRKQYLDSRALAAFLEMAAAARKAGFELQIVSATRNFATQKIIWEQKFSGARKVGGQNLAQSIKDEEQRALEILKFSSMPGTSRHHWGTDMDIHEAKLTGAPLHNESFQKGRGKEFYDWLTANAQQFGFCQPYSGDPAERNGGKYAHGYQEERWHWSYTPVSAPYLRAYRQNATAMTPAGFAGDKAAAYLHLDYVQNIDPACQ